MEYDDRTADAGASGVDAAMDDAIPRSDSISFDEFSAFESGPQITGGQGRDELGDGTGPEYVEPDLEGAERVAPKKKVNPTLVIVAIGVVVFVVAAAVTLLGGSEAGEALPLASSEPVDSQSNRDDQPYAEGLAVESVDMTAAAEAETASGGAESSVGGVGVPSAEQGAPAPASEKAPVVVDPAPAAIAAPSAAQALPAPMPSVVSAEMQDHLAEIERKIARMGKKIASLEATNQSLTRAIAAQRAPAKQAAAVPQVKASPMVVAEKLAPKAALILKAVTPGQAWIEADGSVRAMREGDKTPDGDLIARIDAKDRVVVMASGRTLR